MQPTQDFQVSFVLPFSKIGQLPGQFNELLADMTTLASYVNKVSLTISNRAPDAVSPKEAAEAALKAIASLREGLNGLEMVFTECTTHAPTEQGA